MFMQNKQSKDAINNEFLPCTRPDHEAEVATKNLNCRLRLYKIAS